MFYIIFPKPLIYILIFVSINSFISQIVSKIALELIPIEQDKLPFHFWVIIPKPSKDCSLAEVISSIFLFFAVSKNSNVLIFIDVLKSPLSIRHIVKKLAWIAITISINNSSFTLFAIILESPYVIIFSWFVDMISISFSGAVEPLSLIKFLIAIINSITVL